MKQINFVNTPTNKQHRSIKIWYIFSVLAIFVVGCTATYKQFQQYNLLQAVYSKYKNVTQQVVPFEQIEQQKKELVCTQNQLNQQQCTLVTIKNNPKLPTTLIQAIHASSTPPVAMQSLNINAQQLRIEIVADTSNQILHFVEKFGKNSNVKNTQLVALHPHHKKMRATITGIINWIKHS